MKRTISSLLLATALPLGAAIAVTAPAKTAEAQYHYGYAPPPSWVANHRPYYHGGNAYYYYGGRYYYNHPTYGWRYYERPPAPEACYWVHNYYGAQERCVY